MSRASSKHAKRKKEDDVVVPQPPPKSPQIRFLSPSLVQLEIPADANTSLPVWDAMRSQQVDVAWTVNPYSVAVHFTPRTSEQGRSTTSTRTEGSAAAAATPPSGVLQPQTVVHGAARLSRVPLIPSSQSCSQLLTNPPPPAASPTDKCLQPAIRTPTASPTKPPPPPPPPPAPSPFHTKSSADVEVCDDFLLGLCLAGPNCGKHHTPYPFHWQLWDAVGRRWSDAPPRSQAVLERSYCNVQQDTIGVRDGDHLCSLDFDSMEIADSSKYTKCRRLANSDSPLKNPHFPCKWRICWCTGEDWEEYGRDVSAALLLQMSLKEPECFFRVGSRNYEVDFTTMVQTNVDTWFHRCVRRRPFYRSPDSMRPHLQTGILSEPVGDPPEDNFGVDPLEEFPSWYPPVWRLDPEQDFSLVDVPAGTPAYRSVQSFFYESLPETTVDVIGIRQVQNLLHWDKYQRHKAYMQKRHDGSRGPLERHLFHGTSEEPSEDICHNNFDPRMAGVHGSAGFGSYFAPSASFANIYAAKLGPDRVRRMFLAKVLVGRVVSGSPRDRRPPPLDPKTSRFLLYDTCVDDVDDPTMFVVFDSCQCYPYYLVEFKNLPTEVDV